MHNIQKILELWGGWAATGCSHIGYSTIAAGFKGVLPEISRTRLQCSDNDGLIIEECMARLNKKRPSDYELLVAHYIYGISKRKIGIYRKKNEKQIRVEILLAEGFIEGCLSTLDVKLECGDL